MTRARTISSLFIFLSTYLSASLCFPLPKLRAIMNASIFHLVPSARPSRPLPPPISSAALPPPSLRSCPYFLVPFFSGAPFTCYRPLANGTRLPFAFIHPCIWTGRRDLCPPRSRRRHANPSPTFSFFATRIDIPCGPPPPPHVPRPHAMLKN